MAPETARVIDTAPLTLDEIIAEIMAAHAAGHDVARVHSGDPSIYGAIAEQMRRLDALRHPLRRHAGRAGLRGARPRRSTQELTLPEMSQTVILTRTAVRASAMPKGEELTTLGQSGATLAIHLSINNLAALINAILPRSTAPIARRRRLSRQLAR